MAKVPRGSAEMVAAAVRTIFAQPDAAAVADQLDDDKEVGTKTNELLAG